MMVNFSAPELFPVMSLVSVWFIRPETGIFSFTGTRKSPLNMFQPHKLTRNAPLAATAAPHLPLLFRKNFRRVAALSPSRPGSFSKLLGQSRCPKSRTAGRRRKPALEAWASWGDSEIKRPAPATLRGIQCCPSSKARLGRKRGGFVNSVVRCRRRSKRCCAQL